MALSISVSGINAAQKHLDVTANNIANVNTIGFKGSRAEFADVYSSSIYTDTRTLVGNGVQTASVTQQFNSGSIDTTTNALDMAIKGDGFFVLSPDNDSLDRTFTRAGAFRCNESGYVTNSSGNYLQVYDVNADGSVKSISLDSTHALKIPDTAGSPEETTKVVSSMTLPASVDYQNPENFDPTDAKTFAASTSVKIYDSLGESHTATYYYLKDINAQNNAETDTTGANTWKLFMFVDDKPVAFDGVSAANQVTIGASSSLAGQTLSPATIVFDSEGNVKTNTLNVTTGLSPATLKTIELGQGANRAGVISSGANQTQSIEFAFDQLHMYGGTSFSVDALSQDGSTVGQLTNVEINDKGLVSATYSNGTTSTLGMVALANFANPQGLTQIGDTSWRASLDSGIAVPSQASVGTCGSIQSSALESSNTNLASQLVELITAQRNYQANSRALEVNNTVMDSILNIR